MMVRTAVMLATPSHAVLMPSMLAWMWWGLNFAAVASRTRAHHRGHHHAG